MSFCWADLALELQSVEYSLSASAGWQARQLQCQRTLIQGLHTRSRGSLLRLRKCATPFTILIAQDMSQAKVTNENTIQNITELKARVVERKPALRTWYQQQI